MLCRKHRAVFLLVYPSPVTLYNSLKKDHQSPLKQHIAWLDTLRERIWSRITYEEEIIPSEGALVRHWKRSCWVLSVWMQANSQDMVYPPLHGNGWKVVDATTLEIDWDSDEHLSSIRSRVALLRKGCGCKTGCVSGRCKCKKSDKFCGPGCKCQGCLNLIPGASQPSHPASLTMETSTVDIMDLDSADESDQESVSDSGAESREDNNDLEMEVDEIMDIIFGDFGFDEEV